MVRLQDNYVVEVVDEWEVFLDYLNFVVVGYYLSEYFYDWDWERV